MLAVAHELSILLVFITFGSNLIAGNENPCPSGWFHDTISAGLIEGDRCFFYVSSAATFEDAKHVCRHVGGELVIPKWSVDTAAIQHVIQNNIPESLRNNVWVDMKEQNGGWASSNGSLIQQPIRWYEGYPEGDGDCGVLLYDPGQLKNKLCSLKAAFVCAAQKEVARGTSTVCPPLLPSRFATDAPTGTYQYLSCEEGFSLSSTGHRKAFCRRNGLWSKTFDQLATCQAESCADVIIGDKVMESTVGRTERGSLRNFTCPAGSVFKQHRETIEINIECGVDGRWSSETESSVLAIDDCVPIQEDDGTLVGDESDDDGSTASFIKQTISLKIVFILTAAIKYLAGISDY